jgi:hypothetical protein
LSLFQRIRKIVIFTSSAALLTSTTHAPGKNRQMKVVSGANLKKHVTL